MSLPRQPRAWLPALVLALALLPAGAPMAASKADVDTVGAQLICYCGCPGLTVKACTCGTADGIRAEIGAQLDSGMSTDEVVAEWVAQRGEQILAVPTREGFNLVGWVMPFVATLLGLLVAAVIVLRWQKQAAAGAAAAPAPDPERANPDHAYLERVEQGIKNLRH